MHKFLQKNALAFAQYKIHNSQIQLTKFVLAPAPEPMQISQQEPAFQHVQLSLPFSLKVASVFSTALEGYSLITQVEHANIIALIVPTLIIALGHALACAQPSQ